MKYLSFIEKTLSLIRRNNKTSIIFFKKKFINIEIIRSSSRKRGVNLSLKLPFVYKNGMPSSFYFKVTIG